MNTAEILMALWATKHAHHLNPPASASAISACEAEVNVPIPKAYRAFLEFSDGAELYESIELLGTTSYWEYDETLQHATQKVRFADGVRWPRVLTFCSRYMGYVCFVWSEDVSEDPKIAEWIEGTGFGPVLYDSFESWFEENVHRELHQSYLPNREARVPRYWELRGAARNCGTGALSSQSAGRTPVKKCPI